MVSTRTYIPGNCLNCPLSIQLMSPDQQMNLHTYNLGIFQTFFKVFAGFQVNKIIHMPSKRGISVSQSTLEPHTSAPLVFCVRCSRGSYFWCRSQGPSCPTWGTNLLLLQKCLFCEIPPYCVLVRQVGFFVRQSLPFLYIWIHFYFILCCGEQFIQFSDLFQRGMIHMQL